MRQRVYPWLIVVGWAFIVSATFELIFLGGSNFYKSVAVDIGVPVSSIALLMTVSGLVFTVTVPPNASAIVRLPGQDALNLGPGTYTRTLPFCYNLPTFGRPQAPLPPSGNSLTPMVPFPYRPLGRRRG